MSQEHNSSEIDWKTLGIQSNRAQDCADPVQIKGKFFYDNHGRTLMLRGVNLCGNSKLPTAPCPVTSSTQLQQQQNYHINDDNKNNNNSGNSNISHKNKNRKSQSNHNLHQQSSTTSSSSNNSLNETFFEHKNVSFIGRPFPLHEAKEHFSRLRAWGLTFARLLVPWEALEHGGPGQYDDKYIDYLVKILDIAHDFGIKCFIDPHQDCWSRYSGGSGAPGWTFEVVGLDIRNFKDTGAAIVHQMSADNKEARLNLWPTNYSKLASATMFTVFFGGNIFCPNSKYKNQTLQDFLQSHYIKCYQNLARKLYKHPAVVGFEVMNEPHFGYIGLPSINGFDPIQFLHLGEMPSALQSFALADGIPQNVDHYIKSWPWPSRKAGMKLSNKKAERAWLDRNDCIWKLHNVWNLNENGQPIAVTEDYFSKNPKTGQPIDFDKECYLPFIQKYAQAIHAVDPKLYVFFEPIPNEDPPRMKSDVSEDRLIYSPHWYDLKALFTKSFNSFVTHDVQGLSKGTKNILAATYFGVTGAKENYKGQISKIVNTGYRLVGERPCLIGECGIPMDINEKQAFATGDYSHHNNFLDAVIGAMEANLVNFTLWNYNPVNDHQFGDHWNGEDFSIYSPQNSPRKKNLDLHGTETECKTKKEQSKLAVSITAKEAELLQPSWVPLTPTSPFDITEALIHEGDKDHHHHDGGRALDAMIRPYASKIAGRPVLTKFDRKTLEFSLDMITDNPSNQRVPASINSKNWQKYTTEIFIPNYHYGDVDNLEIEVSDGTWKYDKEKQTLYWIYDPSYKGLVFEQAVHRLTLTKNEVKHQLKVKHPSPPADETLVTRIFKWFYGLFEYHLG